MTTGLASPEDQGGPSPPQGQLFQRTVSKATSGCTICWLVSLPGHLLASVLPRAPCPLPLWVGVRHPSRQLRAQPWALGLLCSHTASRTGTCRSLACVHRTGASTGAVLTEAGQAAQTYRSLQQAEQVGGGMFLGHRAPGST